MRKMPLIYKCEIWYWEEILLGSHYQVSEILLIACSSLYRALWSLLQVPFIPRQIWKGAPHPVIPAGSSILHLIKPFQIKNPVAWIVNPLHLSTLDLSSSSWNPKDPWKISDQSCMQSIISGLLACKVWLDLPTPHCWMAAALHWSSHWWTFPTCLD